MKTELIFMKFDIRVSFENLFRKYKFHQNLTRLTCTLHKDQITFLIISRSILFRMRTKVVEKIKIHVFCSVTSFLKIFLL